jgi:hypothetical protein
MKTFKLNPDGLKKQYRLIFYMTVVMSVIAGAGAIYISYINSGPSGNETILLIPIMLVIMGISLFRLSKKLKKTWNGFEIIIDDDTITRTQNNVPTITIKKEDVREILESRQGGIALKTDQRIDTIHIPKYVENREELLAILADLKQVKKQPANYNFSPLIAVALAIGLFVTFSLTKTLLIILITGLILVILLTWGFIEIQRSKLIDSKLKRGSFLFIFLLLSIVLRMCTQITGSQQQVSFNNEHELFNEFNSTNHLKAPLDKMSFDTLHGWDFGWAMLEPINVANVVQNESQLSKRLSPGQKALYFFWYLDAEVTNGGFIQFYWNGYEKYLSPIKAGLSLIGDKEVLKLVNESELEYRKHFGKFEKQKQLGDWGPLYNSLKTFDRLDSIYYEIHDQTMILIEKYARENPNQFAKFIR